MSGLDWSERTLFNDLDHGPFGFERALGALKAGYRVQRAGWNGKGMWIRLNVHGSIVNLRVGERDEGLRVDWPSLPRLPYIEMKTATDELVPWLASQTDLLAGDWSVIS